MCNFRFEAYDKEPRSMIVRSGRFGMTRRELKPLQFVTILRCWLKMNIEAVDAVESVFSKL